MDKKGKDKKVVIDGNRKPTHEPQKLPSNVEDHLKKLDDQISKAGDVLGENRFAKIREKIDLALKDRQNTRGQIDEVRGQYDDLKGKVKKFLQDQIVNSHKSSVETRKPKLQQS